MSQTKTIENHIGYKETKLGWIPEDWEVLKVDEVFQFLGTNSFSRSSLFYSESKLGIRNIHYGDIHSTYTEALLNGSNYEIIPVIKEEEKLNQNNNLLIDGDLIIADVSEDYEGVGKAIELKNIEGLNILAGLHTFALRDQKEKTIKGFRSYIFLNKKVRNELKRIATGSKVYGISKSNLKKFEVIIPSLPEQKAIANCLSTWDTAITKQTQLIKAKQQQKKALAQQLLTGKKRLKGFSEEWKEKRIEDVAQEHSQKNVENKDIEVLSCTKYDGLVPSLQYFGRQVFGDDLSKYKVVPQGYFAYATNHIEEGSIGYQNINKSGLVSPMYTVFKTDETIDDIFLFKVLKSHKLIHEYNRRMEGSIDRRGGLRWRNFRGIKLNIPSIAEQTAIAQILTTADKEITLLQQQLIQLKLQKKGVMQQLLTGKKRLKV